MRGETGQVHRKSTIVQALRSSRLGRSQPTGGTVSRPASQLGLASYPNLPNPNLAAVRDLSGGNTIRMCGKLRRLTFRLATNAVWGRLDCTSRSRPTESFTGKRIIHSQGHAPWPDPGEPWWLDRSSRRVRQGRKSKLGGRLHGTHPCPPDRIARSLLPHSAHAPPRCLTSTCCQTPLHEPTAIRQRQQTRRPDSSSLKI